MLDPERQNLTEWVEGISAGKRAQQDALRQQKARDKKKRQEWKRLREEDVNYMKQNGVLSAFRDARNILRGNWHDARLNIDKPTTENHYQKPSIYLRWDSRLIRRTRTIDDQDEYESSRVYATVVRSEQTGLILGLQFNGREEIIPPDVTQISERLLQDIKNPKRVRGPLPGLTERVKARFPGAL